MHTCTAQSHAHNRRFTILCKSIFMLKCRVFLKDAFFFVLIFTLQFVSVGSPYYMCITNVPNIFNLLRLCLHQSCCLPKISGMFWGHCL